MLASYLMATTRRPRSGWRTTGESSDGLSPWLSWYANDSSIGSHGVGTYVACAITSSHLGCKELHVWLERRLPENWKVAASFERLALQRWRKNAEAKARERQREKRIEKSKESSKARKLSHSSLSLCSSNAAYAKFKTSKKQYRKSIE